MAVVSTLGSAENQLSALAVLTTGTDNVSTGSVDN